MDIECADLQGYSLSLGNFYIVLVMSVYVKNEWLFVFSGCVIVSMR